LPSLSPRPAVIAFDAYGTLFDLASVLTQAAPELGSRAAELLGVWRTQQLEYTWLRTIMGSYADFRQVTRDALDNALARLDISVPGLRDRLLSAYDTVTPYPEAPALLRSLRHHGHHAVILSNGTPEMLESAVEHAGLRPLLDRIFSVESIRRYKPAAEVYAMVPDAYGVSPSEVLFVSANAWDVAGAATFGLPAIWVNRTRAPVELLPSPPLATISSLDRLHRLLDLPSST